MSDVDDDGVDYSAVQVAAAGACDDDDEHGVFDDDDDDEHCVFADDGDEEGTEAMAASSWLVTSCIARAVDQRELPRQRVSLGMRLSEELIEGALSRSLSHDVTQRSVEAALAARAAEDDEAAQDGVASGNGNAFDIDPQLVLARGLVEGLCDVALRDVSARRLTRSLRAARGRRQRRQWSASRERERASPDADDTESDFAARIVQRWARRRLLSPTRARTRDRTADERRAAQEEAEFAARIVQAWVRRRLGGPAETPEETAAAAIAAMQRAQGGADDNEGDAQRYVDPDELAIAEAEERREELARRVAEYRRSLIVKHMPLPAPLFKSEVAARAFLGRVVALSRTERVSRNDLEAVYDSFAAAVRSHLRDLRGAARHFHAERELLLTAERQDRAEVDDEYAAFVEAAHHAAWALRYGVESAAGYEEICVAVRDAEAAARFDATIEEEVERMGLAKLHPARIRRRHRRANASTSSALDAAHGASHDESAATANTSHVSSRLYPASLSHLSTVGSTSEQHSPATRSATATRAASAGSTARERVIARRQHTADAVRGQSRALDDVRASSRVMAETANHDLAAQRRDERAEKRAAAKREQEARRQRRQAQARLELLARRQKAEARLVPRAERLELEEALKRLQAADRGDKPPLWATTSDASRADFGVDRPQTAASSRRSAGASPPRSSAASVSRRTATSAASGRRSAPLSSATSATGAPGSVAGGAGNASTLPSISRSGAASSSGGSSRRRYKTAAAYGGKEAPTAEELEAARQQRLAAKRQAAAAKRLPPPSASPGPLVRQRSAALMPVEKKLMDDALALLRETRDYCAAARAAGVTTVPSLQRGWRFGAHAAAANAARADLVAADLFALSPRSRLTRWNAEASELVATGQLPAAGKLLRTVKHDLGELTKAQRKAAAAAAAAASGESPRHGASVSDAASSTTSAAAAGAPPHGDEVALLRIQADLCKGLAAHAKASGQPLDAVRHLQQKLEAEERIAAAALRSSTSSGRAPLLPPPMLVAPSGASCETMLSVSALLTAIEECDGALQYGRAAARVISAACIALAEEVRAASVASQWAPPAEVDAVEADTASLLRAAATALHNVALAQLVCPDSVRMGERVAAATTFRACVRLAEEAVGAHDAFTARLRQSSGSFAQILTEQQRVQQERRRGTSPAVFGTSPGAVRGDA